MPAELHSATSTSTTSTLNSSNVNRFHAGSTMNLAAAGIGVGAATPARCNSSAQSNSASNSSSLTTTKLSAISATSATTATPFHELPKSCATTDVLSVATAVAYDLAASASFHHHRPTPSSTHSQHHSHSHQHQAASTSCNSNSPSFAAYFSDCGVVGVDNFPNGLASWEAAVTHHHQSAVLAAASHYHGHHSIHPVGFGTHCDLNLRSAFSIPNASTTTCTGTVPATSLNVPGMTVHRVGASSVRANPSVLQRQNAANVLSAGSFNSFNLVANNQVTPKQSKPRRRVASMAQRRAANIRERRRMFNLNSAFDKLRKKVPTFAYEKRLSRIETLRLAIMYIAFMSEVIRGEKDPCFEPRIPLHPTTNPFQNHQHERNIWNGNHHHSFSSHGMFH